MRTNLKDQQWKQYMIRTIKYMALKLEDRLSQDDGDWQDFDYCCWLFDEYERLTNKRLEIPKTLPREIADFF